MHAAASEDNLHAPALYRQAARALEASGLAFWDYELESGSVYLNDAWAELLGEGHAPTSTSIDILFRMVPEEERPGLHAALVAALKGASADYRVEHRVRTPAGQTRWVSSWGRVVERDAGGRAVRMMGINKDITARKEAEDALRQSEARFKSAFRYSAIGMALLDADGRWLRVNDALCDILGYREEELLATDFRKLTIPGDRTGDLKFLRARVTQRSRGGVQNERRMRRRDGSLVWVQVNLSAVADVPGEPYQVVAQIQDITERRAAEAIAQHMALHDPLTALPNKRLLSDRLAIALPAAKRSRTYVGVIFIDLDEFKPVNDTWGHTAGDAVLRQIAQRLQAAMRQSDTVSRVGGDEFVVLATAVEKRPELERLIERLRAAIERPCEIEGGTATVSASIGLAIYPAHATEPEELLRRADAAMYEAKRTRRCAEAPATRPETGDAGRSSLPGPDRSR